MAQDYWVLCLKKGGGLFEPLAYAKRRFSDREGRKLTAKFQRDRDVSGWSQGSWRRIYDSLEEMKRELPEIK